MSYKSYFNPKKSLQLIQLNDHLNFFKTLIKDNKFPKVTMLSGEKGSGKSTLVNHLMHMVFDSKNYNVGINLINGKSYFHRQFIEGIFPNIIYLGSINNNIKIDDIRNLKNILLKSVLNDGRRFIILDDVENFNHNSLNALLKLIEEPGKNYFILINNKTKPILETIKSRCLEIKIILNEQKRRLIINELFKIFNQKFLLDKELTNISPGNFLNYNYILDFNKINLEENIILNLKKLIDVYKKDKDDYLKKTILFYVEYYFYMMNYQKQFYRKNQFENKAFIFKNLNDFFVYNLNQDVLLNSIESRILSE